ncbi:glycosyltransferase family 2 protein [Aegicerativicinus sediminis]|uniref:glycosyltransferase family 2 protein n=1 Tax=Aegicerativicinus sediminis TaxID=2893202 RepID=UPI001E4B2623|nr:glycosyltransferase family 2 protein [Aegicerativicinus sediminis]
MDYPLISIVVPVKNGIDTLPNLFEGLEKQTIYNQTEIIIIDSGSNDGSVEFVKNKNAILIQIDPKSFNHGATRNIGVSESSGEYLFFTVQDAWTEDDFLLERMLSHFKDEEVVGVCGQQIVPHHNDKNPHEWFRPQSNPVPKFVNFKGDEDFERLTPKEKKNACGWDNVVAMYRKSILVQNPFPSVIFGEDMLWAKNVLTLGFTLVYDYSCRVNHYHHHNPKFTYKRTLIVWYFLYQNFNYRRPDPFNFKEFLHIAYRNLKWGASLKWIPFNWNRISVQKKAIRDFNKALKEDKLQELFESLKIKIPQGNTN